MISQNSMMSIPTNDINVVTIPKNVPDFELEDYDLMDDKDREKYIKDLERSIRSSYEYRQLVQYLREYTVNDEVRENIVRFGMNLRWQFSDTSLIVAIKRRTDEEEQRRDGNKQISAKER